MSKYIKLEDVTTIIANYYPISHSWIDILDFTEKINSLPSIDFDGMIQEMIEDCWKLSDSFNDKMVWTTREKLLQELLNKLP